MHGRLLFLIIINVIEIFDTLNYILENIISTERQKHSIAAVAERA